MPKRRSLASSGFSSSSSSFVDSATSSAWSNKASGWLATGFSTCSGESLAACSSSLSGLASFKCEISSWLVSSSIVGPSSDWVSSSACVVGSAEESPDPFECWGCWTSAESSCCSFSSSSVWGTVSSVFEAEPSLCIRDERRRCGDSSFSSVCPRTRSEK